MNAIFASKLIFLMFLQVPGNNFSVECKIYDTHVHVKSVSPGGTRDEEWPITPAPEWNDHIAIASQGVLEMTLNPDENANFDLAAYLDDKKVTLIKHDIGQEQGLFNTSESTPELVSTIMELCRKDENF